jgi:two-component system OmpR family response regulator
VTQLTCGDLEMDLLQRRVTRAGRRLELLPREFKLLEHLLRHKDRVVTRTMMLEQLWDYPVRPPHQL